MSESFTNRRGHELSVEDDIVELTVPTNSPVQAPVVRKPHIKRRRHVAVHLPWKWIGIVIAAIVLIVLFTLEIARMSYVSSVSSAKSKVADIVTTQVAAAEKQSPLASQTITSLSNQFRSVSASLCPGGILDNFASLYPRSKQAYDDCTKYRSKVETLRAALDETSAEAAYLEQLAPLITPTVQPLADQFAVLSSQQENWKGIADGIKAVTAPVSLQGAHMLLQQQVEAVSSIWVELVAASNDQDSPRFIAARDKLDASYAAVRSSADAMETVLSATQTQLSGAYAQLQ